MQSFRKQQECLFSPQSAHGGERKHTEQSHTFTGSSLIEIKGNGKLGGYCYGIMLTDTIPVSKS